MSSPYLQRCFRVLAFSLATSTTSLPFTASHAYSQVLTSYPSQFQTAPITTLNPLSSTTFSSNSSSCPIPTLSVSGFAASGDNWANFNNGISNASTGAGNYGVTAAISMPFPGELAKQCKENLAAYVRSIKLTTNANLVAACATLSSANIDLNSENFKKYFPDMDVCQYVVAKKAPPRGQESGSTGAEGKFNLDGLRNNPFTFGPQQIPLIQTLPLQLR